jgi:hypothetical protein
MKLEAPPVLEVDPRIEMIAAVEALAVGNPCAHCDKSAYLERVLAALDRDAPVFRLFARMTPQDWRNRHPSLIMLDFGAPPELEITGNADHYARQDSSDALSQFLPALREFASKGFMKFFAKEKRFHASFLAQVRPEFESMDYRTELGRYLGMPAPHRYHFIISPLYHGGPMHNLLYHRKGGAVDIYSISGHCGLSGGLPVPSFNTREMIYQAWHEVLHTLIDAMTQAHRRELEPCSGLYALMKGRAVNQYRGPQGWLHIVDEHVIRAMTSRLMAASFGEPAGMAKLQYEKAEGFVLVELVHQALLEYESSRDRYPAFSDFYPRIVEVFVRARARGDRRRDAPK